MFLCVFLFNIIGYYPVFLLRQQKIRNGISEMLDQNIASGTLVVFSFSKQEINSLRWIRENEFSLNDELYDVVLKENSSDGQTNLYCFKDKKEKRLLTGLQQHISRHLENDARTQKDKQNLIKNLLKDYFFPEKTIRFASTGIEHKFLPSYSHYKPFFPEKQSPPPKSS